MLNRLDAIGCIKRVMVEVDDATVGKTRWLRCVKFVRQPTARDHRLFVTLRVKEELLLSKGAQDDENADEEDEVPFNHGDEQNRTAGDNPPEDNGGTETQRIPPQWSPELLQGNFFFHIVHAHGRQGVTSMVPLYFSSCGVAANYFVGSTQSGTRPFLETTV